VFDRRIVEAVLQEWFITMRNLPAGIRQAVEMVSTGKPFLFMMVVI
jgi:hypothetical protein